ncbi:hypothetical protein HY091_02665 [Candidatus Kaiserbacteria bacterium]|nr:hypothetical protein [Candidatus Kaiserbacteria bacterium]
MPDEMTKAVAEDLGISDLSSEQQQQLIEQFGALTLKAVTVSVLEKMPENKREEFAALSERGDAGALKAFLDAAVPGHEQVARAAVAEEVKRFKEFQAAA